MAERIQEGWNLVRGFIDTPYEAAAIAYLTAQVKIAKCEQLVLTDARTRT